MNEEHFLSARATTLEMSHGLSYVAVKRNKAARRSSMEPEGVDRPPLMDERWKHVDERTLTVNV